MLQSGQQQRFSLDELGLQQHLRNTKIRIDTQILSRLFDSIILKTRNTYKSIQVDSGASLTHLQVLAVHEM